MAVAEGFEPSSWCWSQSKNSPELPIDMLWHTLDCVELCPSVPILCPRRRPQTAQAPLWPASVCGQSR